MKTQLRLVTYLFLMNYLLSSCFPESEAEKQRAESDLKISKYLSENNINAQESEFGIYYQHLTSNENGQKPKFGEVLKVKYEISTLEGKVLESYTTDSTLLRFDNYSVLPSGFNYGVDIMRKGDRIRCYIPSYLAYNNYAPVDQFGPDTNFILDIELVDITTEDEVYKNHIDEIEKYIDTEGLGEILPSFSGLYFISLEDGNGEEAKTYHTATLHYKRKYLDGTLIQETEANKPLTVALNTNQLVEGFREGILKMKEGQKALLIMPSKIAFGSSIKVVPSTIRKELWEDGYIGSLVDAYRIVQYEVELLELK